MIEPQQRAENDDGTKGNYFERDLPLNVRGVRCLASQGRLSRQDLRRHLGIPRGYGWGIACLENDTARRALGCHVDVTLLSFLG